MNHLCRHLERKLMVFTQLKNIFEFSKKLMAREAFSCSWNILFIQLYCINQVNLHSVRDKFLIATSTFMTTKQFSLHKYIDIF